MATYEIWLLDDMGNRISLLDNFNYMAYSRTVAGMGSFQIGLNFYDFVAKVPEYWRLDRRIDIWRSPAEGYPMKRDAMYLLRSVRTYVRDSDGYLYIEFYGRGLVDLVNRRAIPAYAGSSYASKTDYIDDMMKDIVRENALYGSAVDETGAVDNDRAYPQYEFIVQADRSLGPSVSMSFADSQVMDTLKKLRDLSFQKNAESASNRKIYFDVVPVDMKNYVIYILDASSDIFLDEFGDELLDETAYETLAPLGFQFQTFADRMGTDKTDIIEFSTENGNFVASAWQISHMEEINAAYVKGQGEGASRAVETVTDTDRINQSRWNRIEDIIEASNETTSASLQAAGYEKLGEKIPKDDLYGTFLSVPETEYTPRCLYGLDWDLGDLVKVQFGGRSFNAEIQTIHVSLHDDGSEEIMGRNKPE